MRKKVSKRRKNSKVTMKRRINKKIKEIWICNNKWCSAVKIITTLSCLRSRRISNLMRRADRRASPNFWILSKQTWVSNRVRISACSTIWCPIRSDTASRNTFSNRRRMASRNKWYSSLRLVRIKSSHLSVLCCCSTWYSNKRIWYWMWWISEDPLQNLQRLWWMIILWLLKWVHIWLLQKSTLST